MPKNSSTAPKRNVLATVLGMLGMSGIAGVLVAALITPVIAVAGVAANSTITLFESLPSYLQIQPLQQKTELFADDDGERVKIAEFYSQNRVEVALDEISPYVMDAAISTEDPRFFEHGGVDVISAARALIVGLVGDDGGGASTITMQYVRNQRVQAAEAILDPTARQQAYEDATEVTIGRKLQEMRLSIGVEQQYSKEQILEGYLNIALFGGTTYGIESAAQYYFGKPASDLTLAESATLVGTVQNPNQFRIDIEENIPASTDRRNYVLGRMLDEGAIDDAEYTEAVNTPIEPNITPTQHGCMNALDGTEFFCDYVQKVIQNDPAFGATEQERVFNFQTQGYIIDTTIDLDLQQSTTEAMSNAVPQAVDNVNLGAAASVVEPGTGNVLAMQQNKDFDESEAAQGSLTATAVNYNTDFEYGGSSGFPVGSTYKIFTLANWLQSGHSLNEQIDARTRPFNQANFQDSCNGPHGGTYTLQNWADQRFGSMNALEATRNSINTAFVSMGEQLDQCVTRDIAMGLGAHQATGGMNSTLPSAILGSGLEIAPLGMATAVAGIANGGVSCSPIAIESISLRDGTEVAPPESECKQAISEETAAATAYAMETVMSGGTGSASNPGMGPIIGKTGTADDDVHTWMIASTTGIATAVWVGNVSGFTSMLNLGYNGARHQITNSIMQAGIPEYGAEEFPDPSADAMKVENVMVPDVRGMSTSEATAALEGAGFTTTVGDQVDSDVTAGDVANTNPSPNTRAPKGATVTIYPSNGEGADGDTSDSDGIPMPDLGGMSRDEAVGALQSAGLGDIGVTFTWAGPQDGTIVSTKPGAGSVVAPDTVVEITAE